MANRIPDFILEKRSDLLRIAGKYGASNIRIFGSRTRNEQKKDNDSDLDVLARFESGRTYFDLIDMEDELSTLLGCKVDLVSEGGLSPFIGPHILAEAIPLHE